MPSPELSATAQENKLVASSTLSAALSRVSRIVWLLFSVNFTRCDNDLDINENFIFFFLNKKREKIQFQKTFKLYICSFFCGIFQFRTVKNSQLLIFYKRFEKINYAPTENSTDMY